MARVFVPTTGKGRWSAYALGLRNFAMYRYAEEFHNAALKTKSPIVRGYLLGHALELYLKVYLLQSGAGTTELKKKYGHNLTRIMEATLLRQLDKHLHISPELRQDLTQLNTVYSSKALEYFSLFHLLTQPKIPKLARLFRFAGALKKLMGKKVDMNRHNQTFQRMAYSHR